MADNHFYFNDDVISLNNYDTQLYNDFPTSGWIKPCFFKICKSITNKYVTFKYKGKKFKIYICKDCKIHRKRNNLELISTDVYHYILSHHYV